MTCSEAMIFLKSVVLEGQNLLKSVIANGVGGEAIAKMRAGYSQRQSLPEDLHNYLLDLFRRYLIVGGMPDAVNEYLDSHNVVRVREVQESIQTLYGDDASKYEEDSGKSLLIRRIYDMIPSQIPVIRLWSL